jgi:hypothetical protein
MDVPRIWISAERRARVMASTHTLFFPDVRMQFSLPATLGRPRVAGKPVALNCLGKPLAQISTTLASAR